MKKEAIFVALVLTTVMVSGAETENNLLTNGGFENTKLEKGHISGWRHSDWGGVKDKGKTSISIQNDAKEGKSAVKLTTTGKNRSNLILYQNISKKIKPDKEYILTFSFKADDKDAVGAFVGASVSIIGADKGKRLLYKHAQRKTATEQWQEIELSFTVPVKFNTASIILRISKKGVIFDNAVLLEDQF